MRSSGAARSFSSGGGNRRPFPLGAARRAMRQRSMLVAMWACSVSGCAAGALKAQLNPPASSGPCTVLEVQQASVPVATKWFRLRSAVGGMPTQITGIDSPEGLWFRRTAPKPEGLSPQGIQAFPFMGTGMFNAGNIPEIVPCNLSAPRSTQSYVIEAWSDRNDLSDGASAKLLASSSPMTFSFDELGFSTSLKFQDFAVADSASVPGMMTVTAQPNNATAFAMAKLVSWYGFNPMPSATAAEASHPLGSALPTFSLNTGILGDQYTTREFPTPTAHVSYSGPGVWYIGICTCAMPRYCPSSPTLMESLSLNSMCWAGPQMVHGTDSTASLTRSQKMESAHTTAFLSTTSVAPPSSLCETPSTPRGCVASRTVPDRSISILCAAPLWFRGRMARSQRFLLTSPARSTWRRRFLETGGWPFA